MDYFVNEVAAPIALPYVVKGYIPDALIRIGIRKLLQSTLNENYQIYKSKDVAHEKEQKMKFVEDLKTRPIAENTDKANEQHYEVPAELYLKMLGPHLKYSCCQWDDDVKDLETAEARMLEIVCKRADISTTTEPLKVLDLGCGWGSCGLYIAKHYPHTTVTMVSNSASQREFILKRAKDMGLTNVASVETMDANVMTFPEGSFDRIVSNEMFEHMKNYQKLFKKVSSWLKPNGKLFIHIFVHDQYAYHFQKGWMAENFFTGGTMPSSDLFLYFQDDLCIEKQWAVNGVHYSKTLEAWLEKHDKNKAEILPILMQHYSQTDAEIWHFNWRLFYLACSELFAYNGGNEWYIAHYVFRKR